MHLALPSLLRPLKSLPTRCLFRRGPTDLTYLKHLDFSTSSNFYRTTYLNPLNRRLVEAARRDDFVTILTNIFRDDLKHPDAHADELFENRPGLQLIYDTLSRLVRSHHILDIGCGHASLLERLRVLPHTLVGIDLSPVRILRNRPTLDALYLGLAEHMPFPNNSADIVIATEILEHVINVETVINEIHRILKPLGRLFVQVPLLDFADNPYHLRHYDIRTLTTLLQKHLFTVTSVNLIPYLHDDINKTIYCVSEKTPDRALPQTPPPHATLD